MSTHFMGKHFLLDTETARALYENYAEKLPIIDYHSHQSPKEIAEDLRYNNITELWLGADHYKWRAMRLCGVDEKFITGGASDYEKFREYAKCMPKLIGNPLYHWSHMELQRYFGWRGLLSEKTADEVWEISAERLREPYMSARGLIRASDVEVLCTTDDPTDDLHWHKELAEDESFETRVLPAFRPDKALYPDRPTFLPWVEKLSEVSGIKVEDFETLVAALKMRMDFFASLGCRTADHGVEEVFPFEESGGRNEKLRDDAVKAALAGEEITGQQLSCYKLALLRALAAEYTERGWVMQLHLGVIRNVNEKNHAQIGVDSGHDIIDGRIIIPALTAFLSGMFRDGILPRTVIYSLNPGDNAVLCSCIGAFQFSDGSGMPRVTQGSAWWFNDHFDGMVAQMKNFSNLCAFGTFLGMLTDSRSFLSYARHEYFRRILCGYIGQMAESGQFPDDPELLAETVMDICYNNTKKYFSF